MMLPARYIVLNGAICQAYGAHPCIERVCHKCCTQPNPSTESMKNLCLIKLPSVFPPLFFCHKNQPNNRKMRSRTI